MHCRISHISARFFLLIILFCILPVHALAQLVEVSSFPPRVADTIEVERNWRTRYRIILAELEFSAGDTVTPAMLERSLRKIWNLGNFAEVAYRWEDRSEDRLGDDRWALILATRDAITVTPIVSGWMMNRGGAFRLGFDDRNFLGRNIRLEGRLQAGTRDNFIEGSVQIPRQLLYRNMQLEVGYRKDQFLAGYNEPGADSINIGQIGMQSGRIRIGNPWHEDYRYVFSPDIEIRWIQTDMKSIPIFGHNSEVATWYDQTYLELILHESIGTLTRRRHQEEGFSVVGSAGLGMGLRSRGEDYFSFALEGEYARILNPRLQLSFWWRGFHCSSPYPSLWRVITPREINSAVEEEVSIPTGQIAYAGIHYTWVNSNWLAVEQSIFLSGSSLYRPYRFVPGWRHRFAIGTGLEFTIPMYPKASLRISLSYSGPSSPWYFIEI